MLHLKKLKNGLKRAWRATIDYVAGLWERLASEPGYADATASVAVAAVALLCRNNRVVRVVEVTAQALAALTRTTSRNGEDGPLARKTGWDGSPAWLAGDVGGLESQSG